MSTFSFFMPCSLELEKLSLHAEIKKRRAKHKSEKQCLIVVEEVCFFKWIGMSYMGTDIAD
ncbi:hypothetical protein [Psychrosphaera haliotis]|uniref:hypothetical protein n=1 Tax=Psychrosphaera haliotis TaxID=555083 RepID=UPI001E4A8D93|nr:hypothetical protein [Psychrosphaera haliotis]